MHLLYAFRRGIIAADFSARADQKIHHEGTKATKKSNQKVHAELARNNSGHLSL